MSACIRNVVVGTATVLMAWVGFVLSVLATILSVYLPFQKETPMRRLKPRQTSAGVPQPETRTMPKVHHSRSLRTNSTTPTTSIGPTTPASISQDVIVADTQSSAGRSIRLRSCSWDTSHRLLTSFKQGPFPKREPSFVVSRAVTFSSDTTPESPHSISSSEQHQDALFERPETSPRPHSFHIPAFKRCSNRKHKTSRSTSPSRSAFEGPLPPQPLSIATPKHPCLKRGLKQLKKAPSVPIMAGRSNSTARKTTPPPRTRPYEAPYFFPKPGSPATTHHGRQWRATPLRRAATAYEPLASGVSTMVDRAKMLRVHGNSPPTTAPSVMKNATGVSTSVFVLTGTVHSA